jgi:sugar phosphate isomerase/epimerase
MVPLGQGDINFQMFFRHMGAKGFHFPMYEQDNAPGGARRRDTAQARRGSIAA